MTHSAVADALGAVSILISGQRRIRQRGALGQAAVLAGAAGGAAGEQLVAVGRRAARLEAPEQPRGGRVRALDLPGVDDDDPVREPVEDVLGGGGRDLLGRGHGRGHPEM